MAKDNAKASKSKTQGFYDRIADFHNIALKLNGYRASVAKYLRSLDLDVSTDSMILDAGSGTGIVTLGYLDSGLLSKNIIAFDLSHKSLKLASEQFAKRGASYVEVVQGNILELPFPDESFDLILTCGVLEYVSLDAGLAEMARVLRPGQKLVLIPVKPSIVGSVLEYLYKFKIHPIENVRSTSERYFNIVSNHEFPLKEPIAWSKTIFLLEKK
ncbi:MAG: class I SAM-dependent methyltransferase [Blastocatellia bacterium]|nr:class I SAM-dependent methyltransferase [Chloracidobacterium sp.]MBL8185212.1 class I SAM-dependent methyltransferase [Blastocatellia bacterium]HBE82914.1 hypothetical protein [Blastocatellia bacterium]HRJ88264.1 class I SAM-dependent methyltransferase [Pyrinomonadaceae bacterium]HRK49082.1 class I SAM-dependent methyltransferase [Pyrinomonadaceae bacterium]